MESESVHSRRWWALAVLCSSLLIISLDNTILNVALPALTEQLNASTSQLQWIVDGYTLVFAGNVPVCIVALISGYFLLPQSRDPDAPRLDPVGALLSIVGLVLLLWAIIEAPAEGWTDPSVAVSFVLGVLVLAAFVGWELHSDHPMLDVRF